jgi:hypothetical protein
VLAFGGVRVAFGGVRVASVKQGSPSFVASQRRTDTANRIVSAPRALASTPCTLQVHV